MYSDGGYFRAWYRNKEICVDGTGINNIFKGSVKQEGNWGNFEGVNVKYEIWLYVKKKDGTVGWVSWGNRSNWRMRGE